MPILSLRRLMVFYRQLATLINGGVPIVEAMEILSKHGLDAHLAGVAKFIKQYLLEGQSLADAFGRFPGIFPSWQVNIIRYSEKSGRLADGFARLADYLEKDYAVITRVAVALAYPVLLLHLAIFLLPLANLSCPGGYIFAVFKSLFILYGSLFLVFAAIRMLKSSRSKVVFDTIIWSIPIVGDIARRLAVARFVRALQCLCASGVGIIDAWKIALEACGNSIVRNMGLSGVPVLERGEELSKAFIQARLLEPQMVGMVVSGEKTGSIVQSLNNIATFTERDNDAAISLLAGIVPVLVYLAIAGFIGMRIISFYSSYFNRLAAF